MVQVMSLSSINIKLFYLMSFLIMPSAYAATFSNSSIDKQLGANNVAGTFIDTTGQSGGGVERASTSIVKVIIAVSVFVGFVLVAKGLYDMYGVSRSGQGGYQGPFFTLLVGSALAILPVVAFVASNSVQSIA